MQERILLAPGADPTELLRTMAHHGCGSIALRIVGGVELARMALMRCGISEEYTFLPSVMETEFVFRVTDRSSVNYAAAADRAHALHTLRMLIPENEAGIIKKKLAKGLFPEKNAELIDIYDRYMALCADGDENGRPFMDSISVMRLAIEKTEPFDAEFLTLKEFPLTPLEQHLIDKLSAGAVHQAGLAELFGRPAPRHPVFEDMTAAYGSSNEVENIIGRIYKEKLPLDECTVALADTTGYAQLFYDYSLRYDIPVTFGCGIPIVNSNPARLLKLYLAWASHGHYGADALSRMINSEAFNRRVLRKALGEEDGTYLNLNDIISLAGSLRLGSDSGVDDKRIDNYRKTLDSIENEDRQAAETRRLEYAVKLCRELEKDCAEFIAQFSVIRSGLPGRVDTAAVSTISRALTDLVPVSEAAAAVMRRSVCFEGSREGYLHITGISGAMCSMRRHLFAAGLSASRFPGTPSENYLLLDKDYDLISPEHAPRSDRRVLRRKQTLFDLADFAAALDVPMHLSYPSIDLASLAEENPSSSMYDLYCAAKGGIRSTAEFEEQMLHAGFFDQPLCVASFVGAKYMDGHVVPAETSDDVQETEGICIERSFSPTAIEKYLKCSRMFYLNVMLGLKQPEEDDPTVILPATALGTLVHKVMENCSGTKPEPDAFFAEGDRLFDEHLALRPPVSEANVAAERKNYCTIIENAYNSDPGNRVVAAEERTEAIHSGTGIRLSGYPDRVEETPDGRQIIADYKTSRTITHSEDNIDSCIQALLYAYMREQNGHPTFGVEYRYLRYNITVARKYDDDARARINSILSELKKALDDGYFPCFSDEENCKFCPVNHICESAVKKK